MRIEALPTLKGIVDHTRWTCNWTKLDAMRCGSF